MNEASRTAWELVRANSGDLWEIARRLVLEYAASLGIDLSFQDFERELEQLPAQYGPPVGCFVIARSGEAALGCGGIRPLSGATCEMKRLYVTPAGRHRGIGTGVAEYLVREAGQIGYRELLLDTLPAMTSAQRIYESLGFERIAAYRYNPIPGTTYWRRTLG